MDDLGDLFLIEIRGDRCFGRSMDILGDRCLMRLGGDHCLKLLVC